MIWTIICVFALAAILGMLLLSYVLRGKDTPKGVVFTHGPLAAIGIVLLIIYCFIHHPDPWQSLVLFIIAALGGFTMVYRDMTGKSIPKWLAMGHGLLAIIAFIILLVFAVK